MKTVTIRALIARINRKLAHEGSRMRVTRNPGRWNDLGAYHVVNDRNVVTCTLHSNDQLAEMAREIGCVAAGEAVQP